MIYIMSAEEIINFDKKLSSKDRNVLIRIYTPGETTLKPLNDESKYLDILELGFADDGDRDFSQEILKQVFDFFEEHEHNDNIIFHCDAGVSRSASLAVGYCLYKKNYEGLEAIFSNTRYFPNMKITYLLASILCYKKEKIDELYDKLFKRLQSRA